MCIIHKYCDEDLATNDDSPDEERNDETRKKWKSSDISLFVLLGTGGIVSLLLDVVDQREELQLLQFGVYS